MRPDSLSAHLSTRWVLIHLMVDATLDSIAEAVEGGADLIVAHHPSAVTRSDHRRRVNV